MYAYYYYTALQVLRKVRTLKKLSTLKLQQLCEALKEEVSVAVKHFEPGAYVARQGESGDKFYVVAAGEVYCCLKEENGEEEQVYFNLLHYKFQPSEVEITVEHAGLFPKLSHAQCSTNCPMHCVYALTLQVSRVGRNGFFGESALVKNEIRKVSFIAAGPVKLLSLSRRDLEAKIGRLSDIIEADVQKEGKVREVRSADAAVAHSLQGTVYSDLTFLRWAVQLGNHGFVATMEHRRLSRSFSVKRTRSCHSVIVLLQLDSLSSQSFYENVNTARISTALSMSKHVARGCDCVRHDPRCFCTLYKARAACDLATLVENQPLSEQATRWFCACIASGIAHLHEEGIIHSTTAQIETCHSMRGLTRNVHQTATSEHCAA
eukprot:8064-Heterococcus_DN1.PRE.3